jgi:hypothetical protein
MKLLNSLAAYFTAACEAFEPSIATNNFIENFQSVV